MRKLEKGSVVIHYKMPNIPQTLRLVAAMGLNEDGVAEGQSMYEVLAEFLDQIAPHVDHVVMDGKKMTWENALEHPEIMESAGALMEEIMSAFSGGTKTKAKKRSSK